jgi:hypothetical protein
MCTNAQDRSPIVEADGRNGGLSDFSRSVAGEPPPGASARRYWGRLWRAIRRLAPALAEFIEALFDLAPLPEISAGSCDQHPLASRPEKLLAPSWELDGRRESDAAELAPSEERPTRGRANPQLSCDITCGEQAHRTVSARSVMGLVRRAEGALRRLSARTLNARLQNLAGSPLLERRRALEPGAGSPNRILAAWPARSLRRGIRLLKLPIVLWALGSATFLSGLGCHINIMSGGGATGGEVGSTGQSYGAGGSGGSYGAGGGGESYGSGGSGGASSTGAAGEPGAVDGSSQGGGSGRDAAVGGISADCESCAARYCQSTVTACASSTTCAACVSNDFAECLVNQNVLYLAVCQCAQGPCASCAPYCP